MPLDPSACLDRGWPLNARFSSQSVSGSSMVAQTASLGRTSHTRRREGGAGSATTESATTESATTTGGGTTDDGAVRLSSYPAGRFSFWTVRPAGLSR